MRQSPIAKAVETFITVKKALDEHVKNEDSRKEAKKSIRTRSREVPAIILDLGLVPTLSFILAKSGLENLRDAVRLVEHSTTLDRVDGKDFSYAIYAYIVFKYLEEHLRPHSLQRTLRDSVGDDRQLAGYVEEYLRFLAEGMNSQVASKILIPYVEQFKRLCEAEFPKE